VRAYGFVSTVILAATGVAVLVLADMIKNHVALRTVISASVLLAATLLTRVVIDIINASKS